MRFFTWFRKIFSGMVTEHDNQTHDLIKHGGWVGLAAVVAHDAYQLHAGVQTNVKDLAIALATILASVGAGVGFKRSSEHGDADAAQKEGAQ